MFEALSRRPNSFCSACFSGQYPTNLKGVVEKEKKEKKEIRA
jgi:glutamine phosphoribosylpyrophosphate amidotransferase